jgi:hypothetical protein
MEVKEDFIKLCKKILTAILKKDQDKVLSALNEHFDFMDSLFE